MQSAQWVRKAAEQGLADAQHHLGLMFSVGTGVSQDDMQAAQWYRKAADQGFSLAQDHLGMAYSLGATRSRIARWVMSQN